MIRLDPFVLGMTDRSGRHTRDYPSPLADSTSFTSGLVQLRDPVGHTRAHRSTERQIRSGLSDGSRGIGRGYRFGRIRAWKSTRTYRTNAWPLAARGIVHRDQRGSGLLGVA